MQLDSNFTKITCEEVTREEREITSLYGRIIPSYWNAELEGISMKGEHIQMERYGKTPDEAIKNLFAAMSEADVTL